MHRSFHQLTVPGPFFAEPEELPRVSLVVPMHNEAEQLGQFIETLCKQPWLPGDQWIFVCNGSTDATPRMLQEMESPDGVELIRIFLDAANKKLALIQGREAAQHAMILGLDADVHLPEGWLMRWRLFPTGGAAYCGTVVQLEGAGLLAASAGLDSLALVGSGMGLAKMGMPIMANGANLHLARTLWQQLPADALALDQLSGDDVFLIQYLAKEQPNKLVFVPQQEFGVCVAPPRSWYSFIRQRARWGGKTPHYTSGSAKAIALLVALTNFTLVLGVLFLPGTTWTWLWVMKLLADVPFLWKLTGYYRRTKWRAWLPLVVLIHPFLQVAIYLSMPFWGRRWS